MLAATVRLTRDIDLAVAGVVHVLQVVEIPGGEGGELIGGDLLVEVDVDLEVGLPGAGSSLNVLRAATTPGMDPSCPVKSSTAEERSGGAVPQAAASSSDTSSGIDTFFARALITRSIVPTDPRVQEPPRFLSCGSHAGMSQ